MALKKSSNNEIFQHIKKILDGALKDKDFKNENEKQNFTSKDGRVLKYEPLDTSVLKLRKKYANLKTEWRKISDRAKTGSGLAPEKEPKWYNHINEIFSETNADLDLAAESGNLSFTQQFNNLNYSDEDSDKPSDNDAYYLLLRHNFAF